LSDASKLCKRCTNNAACGADGNRCTNIKSGLKDCTFACIDDTGCPTRYSCRNIVSGGTVITKQCVPTSLSCN